MDIREKLKAKRRKKKSLVTLTSIALVTTTLATMKLTGLSMPFEQINTNLVEKDTKTVKQLEKTIVANKNGTAEEAYAINTEQDLIEFQKMISDGTASTQNAKLMNNISFNEGLYSFNEDGKISFDSSAQKFSPIGTTSNPYTGVFDGNGKTISGIYINEQANGIGLFSMINERAEVNNVTLKNSYVYGNCAVGGIIGYNEGTIYRCKTENTTVELSLFWGGGIVGANNGEIIECIGESVYTYGPGTAGIAGINGANDSRFQFKCNKTVGKIYRCYSTGYVGYTETSGIASHSGVYGGEGYVYDCYSRVKIRDDINRPAGIVQIQSYQGRGGYIYNSYYINTENSNITSPAYPQYYGSVTNSYSNNLTITASTLNGDRTDGPWVDDTQGINDGYPILKFENKDIISLNKRQEYIKIDEKLGLEIVHVNIGENIIDEHYTGNVIWTSSNEDVATVDSNGVVTGISLGHTTITAYSSEFNLKTKAIINVYRNKEGVITVPQVETGEGFTVVLKEDGTVWTTGNNNVGQLGNGTTTNSNVPVQVKIDENTYLTNIRKISTNYDYTFALTAEGKVYAWGDNSNGRLGLGDTTNRLYATQVKGEKGNGYIEDIIDIETADVTSFLLSKDGYIYGSGENGAYQIDSSGTNKYTMTKLSDMTNGIQITAGYSNLGVITLKGEVFVKGNNAYGAFGNGTTAGAGGTYFVGDNINEIRLSGYRGTIIKEDGTVWTTGLNNVGQLGIGDTTNRTSYTKATLENGDEIKAKYIATGPANTMILGKDNKVYVTGYNANGQLSNGITTNSSYYVQMKNSEDSEVTDAIFISAGQNWYQNAPRNNAIIRQDGTVWVSGDNTYGQIGNATNTSTNYLTKVGTNEVILNKRNEYIKIGDTLDIDVLEASGFNVFIQEAPNQSDWTWTSSNEDVATIDNSGIVTGKGIGHTTITGYNLKNGLKAKAIVNVYRNKEGAITIPQLEEGGGYSIVLKEDGTVWATGLNNYGQLGLGDTTNRNILEQVKIDENTYLTNVRKISTYINSTVAVTLDGNVYTWGSNAYGKLGLGDTNTRTYATQVKGIGGEGYLQDIDYVMQGYDTTYAINKKGELFGWGEDEEYELLGMGEQHYPIKITRFSNVVDIKAGCGDASVMLRNSEVWSWGHNPYGTLGNGVTSNISTEAYVGNDIIDRTHNGYSSYMLKEDKTIWSSGLNNYGQLGNGTTTNKTTYTQVMLENGDEAKAKTIQAGSLNFQFIGTDGKVYVTGYNGYGQLSNGTTTNVVYPTVMLNAEKTEVIDAISLITGKCAYNSIPINMGIIRQDGTVWLSGDNTYGQIGNETNTSTKYLTKLGINEVILNERNEYVKIGDDLDIDVLKASGFNVFIQDEMTQEDWTWKSSNEDVATVDNNGIVKGKEIGQTTITGYNSKIGLKARAIINVYRNKEGAITVPQVEEGEGYSIVLKEDGTVWATGKNHVGQLGDGTTTNRIIPVQVKIDSETYLTDVIKISSAYAHTIALTKDGEVYAWGYNDQGQLGQGDTANKLYATKVKGIAGNGYIDNIKDISMSHNNMFVMNEKGEILCCGYGGNNELLGNTTTYTLIKLNIITNVVSINSGYSDVGAILSNGETWIWGHNLYGSNGNGSTATTSTETCLGNDIIQIKLDGYSGYILKEDGTIWSSGLNNYGQLGVGDNTNRITYTQVKFENGDEVKAKTIEAGSKNFQFIGTDGKVYVTGYNGYSQLGDKSTANAIYPKVMTNDNGTEITDAISLIAGSSIYTTVPLNMGIIRQDGTVWIAGDNTYGQIGNETNTSTNYLTKFGNNEVILNKRNEYIKIGEILNIDVLYASGFNVFIQDTPEQSDWTWKSSNEDVATVDNNGNVTGKAVGRTTITGYNSNNGLKAKAIINVYRNVEGAITVPQVEVGQGYSIILKEDGTVWATGINTVGQLGDGTTTNRNIPVQVKIDANTYLTNVKKIKTYYSQTVAITMEGYVYAWGDNSCGQLGQGNTTNLAYATKVKGVNGNGYIEDIIEAAVGQNTIYLINNKGDMYAAGTNQYYEIDDTKANTAYPKKMEMYTNVITASAGNCDVIIMQANAEVWTRGHNGYGNFGNGKNDTYGGNYKVGTDINDIEYGISFAAVIKEDGTVWTTGYNDYGQLGVGDKTNRTTYTKVTLESEEEIKAKYIKASASNLSLLGKNGKVYVTGDNANGQVSNGTKGTVVYPTLMLNKDNTEVTDTLFINSASGFHNAVTLDTAIIRQDGTVWLSGDNTYGQIGNATNTSASYLTKMGDGFLNYPEKWITISVNESKKINSMLFNIEEDMNVFVDKNSKLGDLTYTVEDEEIASVTDLGMITGKTQGITKIKVQDTVTGATTNIWVKVVNDRNVQIDLGYKFTVALKQDGSVWSWGENHVGQLGLGNTTYYNEPQKITGITEKITDVKSGYYHSIALTQNGEVYTWGYNYYGQCGTGDTQNVLTPVKVEGLTNMVKIDAYKYMTIALTEGGEVYVWGNGYGSTPVKLNFTRKIIDVAGNIVLAENRRAYNLNETTSYGKDLIKISAGENHYLGLTADGEIFAWGTNNYGQLGNGNNTSSNIPTKVVTTDGTANISDIVEISAGNHYSIITDKDGKVYTFGYYGDYRTANTTHSNKPVEITGLSKAELVTGSEGGHTAIADWDGYVYTVGLNDAGQLGLKDNSTREKFEMVGELQITCNPEKITMHVGDSQNISLSLSSSFNLKSDNKNTSSVNKQIANETVASLSEDTVTALSVGKTILNATYEGTIGSVSTDIQKFYRNIEIEVLPEGGIVVPKVETGNGFTISLKADGTVWSWGQNQYGQLGLGNTVSYNEPQKVSIIKETITNADGTTTKVEEVIKDIAVGNYQVLALGETGKVYTWGLGNCGQLGVGNGYNYYTPVIATDIYGTELKDIVKVEAGENVSFAIDSKGISYAWGNGYTSRAQKLDVTDNIIDVTSKYVLSRDGKVYNIATKEALAIVGKIVEIDEGTNHIVMLTSEQKAYAIGDNTYGQLANGNNVPSEETPVAVRIDSENLFTGIKEIKAGDKTTTIVTTDGKIYTCGMNDNNELGIENTEILDRNLPEENTNISNVIFANVGSNHVVVVKEDGTVYAWGNGKQGELGNRTNKNSIVPVMVGDYIVRTNTNEVVLQVNEEKIVEGYVDYFNIFNNDAINLSYTSKDSSVVTLSNETINSNNKFEIKLTGKKTGTTIVTANQENSSNIGVIQVEVVPETLTASDLGITISPDVITNGSHTISLRVDGKVFTWGDNTYGQLGNGTTVSSDEPVEVTFPEGTIITKITAGENHNVALDSNGNVWTWGRNNNYQIGHSGGNQYTPYKVTGLPKVIRVSAGNNNTMVITENNELYAWGLNAYGDLGLGTYTNKVLPTKVTGIGDIIDISGGKSHFIALNRAGEVYVTGSNLYGQLGIGTNEINKINEFTKLNISEKVGTVDSGDLSNIVTTVDGYVYAWGGNTYGQLGTSDKENKDVPIRINNVQNIREVDVGKAHTVIRDGSNNVFVTGTNTYGMLGIGTKDTKLTFEQNTKIDNVIRVSAGNTYTTFLKEDGFVWACGDYNHGDKEKKSRTKAQVPVLVGSDTSSLDTMEIVLMKSQIKNIMANAKFKFNLIYIEENDTSDFNYSSYNEEIAKVNEDGDILGIREGTTWVKVTDGKTGKVHIAIVRVIDNNTEYETHVAPNVVAGENFAVALKEDGTIWTWGYDASGLADTNVPINTNVLSTYKQIDAGKNHAVAIRIDGTVWSVGDNSYGQLGIGSLENKSKLVQIEGLTDITSVIAGETHTLAIDSYGIVYGWGSNANGELSSEYVGQDTNIPVVITIPNERIMQIAAGKNQSVFVTSNGTVYGMGSILNGYVPNIENAVKVDVGDNYILILRADGSIYKYQYGILTKVSNVTNAIDISVQNKVNMYQSQDEKAYTWGVNTSGQLGINSTSSVSTPVQVAENGTNVFRIGSGYNNTFTILNTGFTYAAGNNTYGELGNGTSNNETSTTKDRSLVHTLVGDRNFEIEPTSNTLEINEIEEIEVESNTFNVFSNKVKDLSEYNWNAEDGTIVTVLDNGKIQGINIGTTKLLVTDKVTGETKEGTRVVVPVDTDRIESITASGKEAEVTDAYKYEVRVPVDDTTTTSQVTIKTKLGTDQISVDGGTSWQTGIITTTVDITNDSTTLPFIVKTEAGNELNYTLTIIRVSNDNTLSNITVKKAGETIETPASKISNKVYEIVVPNSGVNVVKVTANHSKAQVSIKGLQSELKEQTYNLVMTKPVEELPIKITSESGREESYTLRVYTKEYVTTLSKVLVNGVEATKVSDTDYQITITDEIDLSSVKAITNLSTSKVGINGGTKQVNQVVENVSTKEDSTVVVINVENEDGTLTNEYTLTINKQRVNSKIQELQVEGQTIKEINNVYTAYVTSDVTNATVKITAKDTDYYITLADFAEESYVVEKGVEVNADTNTYSIKVRDDVSGEIENYTLIIKRGDTEVGIKDIYAVNGSIVKTATQVSDTEYEIKVLDTYTDTNLSINTINPQSKIAIGQDDIDANNYSVGTNTKTISLTDKETTVPVVVTTADGGETKEYTVKIIRVSDDASLNVVAINELLGGSDIVASLSATETDTYEVQLQNPVTLVKVIASTTNANANIKILDGEFAIQSTDKEITIDSSITEVKITVKSENGTEKVYTLKIKTLSDDSDIQEVVVDGITATYNKILGRYEVRLANTYTKYNITTTAKDSLAKATIKVTTGDVTQVGTAQAEENKSGEETIVPITVIAQNGIASTTYSLAIIEQSDVADIGIVKVNGTEITADGEGNYIANVKSTTSNAEIFVQAKNEYAKTTVDSETNNTNNVTITRTITENSTVYTIKVVSEDGTNTVEKTLTINRLSGNTNISSIKVETLDGATYTPILQADGTYYVKVKRQDSTDVTVTLEDTKSSVTIAGEVTNTQTVTLLNEITEVNVLIEAEDGTQKTELIKIEKESNDASLLSITSNDALKVSYLGSDKYEIQVYNTLETLTINAETTNKLAKIKLGTEDETQYVLNKLEGKTIDLTTGITSFTIDVLAEDGTTTKTYTVEITKKFDTKLESIVVDDETATKNENIYSGWANADDILNIVITPANSSAKVSVYKDNDLVKEGTGTITLAETSTSQTATYKIIVSNPDNEEESSTYILNVTKKSTNNNVEYVKVNGVTLTENTDTGIYETQVITATNDNYVLEVKAENEYATIKYDDGQYSTTNTQSATYTILPGETKEVVVTVKSQNGEEITKTVRIYRMDNNLNVTTVKVNGTDITANYDEGNKTYNVFVDNNITSANLEIELESSKSKLSTTIDGTKYDELGAVVINNINLPDDKKVITFTVTSEEGKTETRTINIAKKSTNNNVEYVKVNGVTLTENTDTEIYETQVVTATDDNYVLEVKAENEYATIKFDDGEYSTTNTQSATYTILPGETKEVVVTVKSQNGEEVTKTVKIYRKDNNLNVTTVKVNGTDIIASYNPIYKNYSITLDNTLTSTNLEIALESTKSKLSTTIDGNTYENVTNILVDNVSLPGIGKKEITFTVTSEEGTTETRTITISQFSSDIELEKLQVNGKDATKLNDGNYEVIIGDIPNVATIYAKAKETTTSVGINGNTAVVGEQTININNITVGSFIQVPVRLTAADGTEYEYELYITVKSGNNKLETVKVNNIDATKLDDTTYRIFVNETATQATVDITAESGNSIIKTIVSGAEETGNPLNFVQTLSQEKTKVNFTIVSESGEEKEYTLEIIKESNDNTLKNVYVNGIELQKDETTGRYKATVNVEDGNPVVKAITNNEFGYVRIGLFEEEQAQSEKTVELQTTKVTTIPITVRSQTGVTNIEYIDIEKIYSTASIDTLAVDGIEVTNYNDNTKTYTAIVDGKLQEHEIFIMSGNTYATIEINEDIGAGNVTTFTTMNDEIYYKTIPFTVTSESGEVITYKLTLVKKSSNVKVSAVIVNDVTLEPDTTNADIYRKNVKKLADKAKVKVVTEYPYASVKIGDNEEGIGTSEVWVDLNLTQDEITVPVLVTATDGETIATYNIILTRLSNDTSAIVSYDGVELSKDENGKYNVSILDTVTEGVIKVITNDENAKVDIANTQEYVAGEKEYTLSIDTTTAGRTIEVPITVISADETVENSTLVITRISTDDETKKVEGTIEVDGTNITKEAVLNEDGVYVLYVKEDTDIVTLKITADEYATIKRNSEIGVGTLETQVTLANEKNTYVNYTVTSEAGTTPVTYTVKIERQSSDTSIGKITVEGKEITADESGNYNAEVEGGTIKAQVVVTLTSDLAKAEIGTASNTAVLNTQVEVTNVENTYTIKVTAEDGTVKEYTLKITRKTNIVGTILTENAEGKHSSKVIVYKTSDARTEDIENILNADETTNENVRQPVEQIETEEDGSFIVKVEDIEEYDIVVVKEGYLSYRVTGIGVVKGETTTLDEYNLIAGDVVETGEIEIDDLVALNDNFGVTITDANKDTKSIYDLNEDGIVNKLDRDILKKNYGKLEETVEWVKPYAISMFSERLTSNFQSPTSNFILPMTCEYVITSEYGERIHPITGATSFHSGIDIVGEHHTEILAVADGEVTYAGVQSGYGNCVEIKHIVNGETIYSFYAHLSRIDVTVGQTVSQGDVIGLEGGASLDPNPGTSTGHHLHFELRSASGSGHSLNPNNYIEF